jgi:hypothetical protein
MHGTPTSSKWGSHGGSKHAFDARDGVMPRRGGPIRLAARAPPHARLRRASPQPPPHPAPQAPQCLQHPGENRAEIASLAIRRHYAERFSASHVRSWIEQWEMNLDEVDLDLPEPLEELDSDAHADELEDAPATPVEPEHLLRR